MRRASRTGWLSSEFLGTLVFGCGLLAAAGLNFVFFSSMGRLLPPQAFGTLGVLIAALLAVIGPVNALSGGTEMFAALHDRFPRGRGRLWVPAAAVPLWGLAMLSGSPTVRAAGWFALGASALVLLAWNRGALAGLGRFSFVGVSFAVEGAGRAGLAALLVALGFGLEGAAAGFVLGMLVALGLTELAVPRGEKEAKGPLGREVWLALVGLFALGFSQIVDVFAVRLANPSSAGGYVGAASLARMALFSQMPAAAYALRRSAVEGPRRALPGTLVLALVPGLLAFGLIELFPGFLLHLAYGSRYGDRVEIVRILGAAMLLGGFATVAAQLLMGRRSTAWVWPVVAVGGAGTAIIATLTHAPLSVALCALCIQAGAFVAVGLPALAAVRQDRPVRTELRVLILNWRDTGHPQGGGSEVYVEQVARRLVARGHRVTMFCSSYPGAAAEEMREGVRVVRRGGWRTVYGWAFVYHLIGRLGPHDAVIDVKNGIPFFAPLYCRRPVACLVHHVHRDQWRMNFSPRLARLGWWIESRLSPRAYGSTQHVVVSEATGRELSELGVPDRSIEVIHNGAEPVGPVGARAPFPTILCLGRLVPHKRVELVLDAAAELRGELPDLRVVVAGRGPWEGRLRDRAGLIGVDDVVSFDGWVDEETKARLLGEAWVLAMPSVMEGWGLAVAEAAVQRTPTVAFRVGGLQESIANGETGLLADDPSQFTEALRRLLVDERLRSAMGAAAANKALRYSWDATAGRVEALIARLVAGEDTVLVLDAVPSEATGTEAVPVTES